MGQFDNLKSILMLFTGAFLVSLGVIAFLNIETQSRSIHGTKIRNENMFEALGKKLTQMISTLKERNSHRRSILQHLIASENSTRIHNRKLQHYPEDSNAIEDFEEFYNRTNHRLRHEKKIRRLTELRHKQKLNAKVREETFREGQSEKTSNVSDVRVSVSNLTNNKSANLNWTKSGEIFREKLGPHQNCYTTNDVLEIIAITCLVNFIFWFLIISCVNIFTRNRKMWKSESFESLASIESGSDYEINQREIEKDSESFGRDCLSRHNVVQEYVNFLKMDEERERKGSEAKTVFPDKRNVTRKTIERRINVERWRHRKFIHLPSIFFDMISLDNVKPINKKNFVKNKKIVNSLSMEDLIF